MKLKWSERLTLQAHSLFTSRNVKTQYFFSFSAVVAQQQYNKSCSETDDEKKSPQNHVELVNSLVARCWAAASFVSQFLSVFSVFSLCCVMVVTLNQMQFDTL